jgi:hypothetical protein
MKTLKNHFPLYDFLRNKSEFASFYEIKANALRLKNDNLCI